MPAAHARQFSLLSLALLAGRGSWRGEQGHGTNVWTSNRRTRNRSRRWVAGCRSVTQLRRLQRL